jgi:hypothetical protein
MKASEVIARLQELIKVSGDREVRFPDNDFVVSVVVGSINLVPVDDMACDESWNDRAIVPEVPYYMVNTEDYK